MKERGVEKKMTMDKSRELCHSAWCPQMGNHIQVDHNPYQKHISEQIHVLYQMEREEGEE